MAYRSTDQVLADIQYSTVPVLVVVQKERMNKIYKYDFYVTICCCCLRQVSMASRALSLCTCKLLHIMGNNLLPELSILFHRYILFSSLKKN
jgi:hypothetical protein